MNTLLKSFFFVLVFPIFSSVFFAGCAYPDMKRPAIRNYFRDLAVRGERPPEPERVTVEQIGRQLDVPGWDESQAPEQYILGPGDVVDVKVWMAGSGVPELEIEVSVTAGGRIRCPMLGETQVEGLTVEELSDKLTSLYAEGFFHRPFVDVSVVRYYSRRAVVSGYVKEPGAYPVMGKRTSLLQLLFEAGGPASEGGDIVTVTRAGSDDLEHDDSVSGMERVDIRHLLRHGDMSRNIWIYPGDVVHLQPARPAEYFHVQGFVRSPGAYEIEREVELGLTDALARAGGLDTVGRPQYVYLIREERGEHKVYNVDISRITGGREPDVPIQANDRIIASTDGWRRFTDGLLRATGLRFLFPRY